ncbi:MAG: type II toxin-antitoxin system RelE/ParE family toxin [Tepidisphaeraceae bacterium]|jgi:mRNA-degrading endonuclease RelE of RelBE toxin-antitoxin system
MAYRIEYSSAAESFIRRLDREMQIRVLSRLEAIARAPRAVGAIKLSADDAYHARAVDYRAIYSVLEDTKTVLVAEIAYPREHRVGV